MTCFDYNTRHVILLGLDIPADLRKGYFVTMNISQGIFEPGQAFTSPQPALILYSSSVSGQRVVTSKIKNFVSLKGLFTN